MCIQRSYFIFLVHLLRRLDFYSLPIGAVLLVLGITACCASSSFTAVPEDINSESNTPSTLITPALALAEAEAEAEAEQTEQTKAGFTLNNRFYYG